MNDQEKRVMLAKAIKDLIKAVDKLGWEVQVRHALDYGDWSPDLNKAKETIDKILEEEVE